MVVVLVVVVSVVLVVVVGRMSSVKMYAQNDFDMCSFSLFVVNYDI